MLIFGLGFVITTPSFVVKLYGSCSIASENCHQIRNGKSPLIIVQVAVIDSSMFNSSSPKEKPTIEGKTLFGKQIAEREIF